jgi:hypothetical protein
MDRQPCAVAGCDQSPTEVYDLPSQKLRESFGLCVAHEAELRTGAREWVYERQRIEGDIEGRYTQVVYIGESLAARNEWIVSAFGSMDVGGYYSPWNAPTNLDPDAWGPAVWEIEARRYDSDEIETLRLVFDQAEWERWKSGDR